VNVETAKYKQDTIRYTIVSDNGILLNTKDVCRVLGIDERASGGVFCEPCMDIAGVIKAALTEGKDDVEFVDWLEANFVGYEMRTPIRPNCDDDWKLK
jgi:hypothetical protein